MTDQPTRPVALTVIPENIPAELKQRPQWVCWRYELRKEKWTKVPYGARDYKAASNRPTSWQSFQGVWELYQAGGFDGIGFVFSADDPYVGGDQDHNLNTEGLPHTYTEVSPSGTGLKFIARAAGHYGRKTVKGELYSSGRFFTITGHVLEGRACIAECQDAVDTFLASLGGTSTQLREGKPGKEERAAYAAQHTDEEWDACRQERRNNIHPLLGNLRASAMNYKTGKRDTQLGYLLKEDYRGFHEKWPHVGIIRGDGSIDSSQIRAVMANSIRGRGFAFTQFVALMSYFFGAECADKWGTKQAVQEEFATLWAISRTPRTGEYQRPITEVKRGKGSDHARLLDRAYQVLEDYKAGIHTLITQQELADELRVHRRTALTLMQELVAEGKITYTAMKGNAGLVVSFPGVINEKDKNTDVGHSSNLNGHSANGHISAEHLKDTVPLDVINETDELGIPDTETEENNPANENEMGVINKKAGNEELGSTNMRNDTPVLDDERDTQAAYIYINTNSVSLLSGLDHTPITCKPDLRAAVSEALDTLPKKRAEEGTGELRQWPITNPRIVEYVQLHYAEQAWPTKAIEQWAEKVRKQRKNAEFEALKGMTRTALEKKIASIAKRKAKLEERAATDPSPDVRKWAAIEARKLNAGQYAWELNRRDQLDSARIATEGYSQGEQAEMLELIEKERRPPPTPIPRVFQPSAAGLIARLKARHE